MPIELGTKPPHRGGGDAVVARRDDGDGRHVTWWWRWPEARRLVSRDAALSIAGRLHLGSHFYSADAWNELADKIGLNGSCLLVSVVLYLLARVSHRGNGGGGFGS